MNNNIPYNVLDVDIPPISSTDIRGRIARGQDISKLVPESIVEMAIRTYGGWNPEVDERGWGNQ